MLVPNVDRVGSGAANACYQNAQLAKEYASRSNQRVALVSGWIVNKSSKRLKRQICALRALLEAASNTAFVIPAVQAAEPTAEQTQMLKSKLASLRSIKRH